MSKVCTIIAYIVSIYSNIEQWNLALSYSILLLSLVFCFSIFGIFTFNEFVIVSRFYVCIYR